MTTEGFVAENMVKIAKDFLGSEVWSKAVPHPATAEPIGSPKCNLFVSDVVEMAGGRVPQTEPGSSIKTPIETKVWIDPEAELMKQVPCWKIVNINADGSGYEPGDVATFSGHMGIVTGHRLVTSASTLVNKVVENDWGFRPGQKPTFWRWSCKNKERILSLDEINAKGFNPLYTGPPC